ncbi:MAG: hypothetical protein BV459_08720, partial [Thermoplasmata archaeon M11B2D]
TSVVVETTIIFKDVTLTIRAYEAIPIDYLMFVIYTSTGTPVANVTFDLDGTILYQNPSQFTVIKLTNTSNLPYNSSWGYGIDEEKNNITTYYDYGYGYGPSGSVDLSILYDITYKTHTSGTFYAKLFVNSTSYTYISAESILFTVTQPYIPPPPPGGGDVPSNDPPIADAGGPYKGNMNVPITFDGSNSTDDVGVAGYRWDWENDGIWDTNWSTSAYASHAYNAIGVYTVRLQVKDEENLTDTATSIVTINGNNISAPVAIADGPYKGLTYQTIKFDGSESYGINANIVNYTWVFGDGTSGYGQSPVHVYETSGTFLVVLTVTDSNNLQSLDSTTAKILLDANRNNISDIMEETIGTPITEADIELISINDNLYYLVDIDHDGTFDVLYNPTTNTKSILGEQDGKPLIDIDGDGIWDFVYDPALGTISPYEPPDEEPLMLPLICVVVIVISVIVVILIFWLYKTGRI